MINDGGSTGKRVWGLCGAPLLLIYGHAPDFPGITQQHVLRSRQKLRKDDCTNHDWCNCPEKAKWRLYGCLFLRIAFYGKSLFLEIFHDRQSCLRGSPRAAINKAPTALKRLHSSRLARGLHEKLKQQK